jgi:hypothetical protein
VSPDEPENAGEADDELIAEARWPMAGAVLAAMVLTILLPNDFRHFPVWLVPVRPGCERIHVTRCSDAYIHPFGAMLGPSSNRILARV